MALIVENGAVVTGAESYVTVAEYKTYCTNRGISFAALTDPQIEQAARRAWDYLLQKYRGLWKGYRKSAVQEGDWPRTFVYLEPFLVGGIGSNPLLVDSTIVPKEIKYAQIELMLRGDDSDLLVDLTQQETSITVGPISVSYDKSSEQQTRYEAVEGFLKIYLVTSGRSGSYTVQRA